MKFGHIFMNFTPLFFHKNLHKRLIYRIFRHALFSFVKCPIKAQQLYKLHVTIYSSGYNLDTICCRFFTSLLFLAYEVPQRHYVFICFISKNSGRKNILPELLLSNIQKIIRKSWRMEFITCRKSHCWLRIKVMYIRVLHS